MTVVGRTGHLGLGSNLGDRRAHLQAAVDELRRHQVEILACSSTYDTEPVSEVLDQPLPQRVRPRAHAAGAHGPLGACKEVERVVGRTADEPRRRHCRVGVDGASLLTWHPSQQFEDALDRPGQDAAVAAYDDRPLL